MRDQKGNIVNSSSGIPPKPRVPISNITRKAPVAPQQPKLNSDLDFADSNEHQNIYYPDKPQPNVVKTEQTGPTTVDEKELRLLRKENQDYEEMIESLKSKLQAKTVEFNRAKKKLDKYEKEPD